MAFSMPEKLRGRDIIWFIDNTSAESALVKCGSATLSMAQLALQASAAFAALQARVWFEYVPSADNPADVFSRAGYSDPQVACAIASGQIVTVRAVSPPTADFTNIWEILETLA